jgi:hypothetical protein
MQALKTVILWAYVPALAIIGGITGYALATDKRIWYFTNDIFVLGNLPFYAGVLSSLGNLLWGATATICFFSALLLKGEKREEERGKIEDESNRLITCTPHHTPYRPEGWRQFLLGSGLFTTLLLLDDQFQFHRIFYIKYLHLTATAIFAGYGLLAFGYLIQFRSVIAETDYLLLGSALAFFGAAVFFDTTPLLPRGRTAFSDYLKFLGIVTWVAYFGRVGRQALRR